ncbi:type VI secretion system-associated FHA domain protein TagH [Erwinia oleae]|uniref:type VI secretion system-associated FHA domain protein TagH n=1 Tax=Erwinia oleae TaxID=796334 RepID=UPI00054D6675|nr:type VI secretion system-associated FHA domain protein TagH [Erwinia oleae]
MRFTIIANKPGHQPPQSSFDFAPPGGTVGRGPKNNLVLPDDKRTISRLQALVHINAEGECRITNRGNVTQVHLNDIPLARGRQVELQEGDVLTIDEYRIQVSELSASVPQAAPVVQPVVAQQPAPQPAATESTPAAIPSEIWDSLAQEFSITDNLSSRSKPAPVSGNPLTEGPTPDRNPVDPLAQFSSADLNLDRRESTPDALFNEDPLFKQQSIFDDSTPSTLLQQPAATPQQPVKGHDEVDPLALFGGGGGAPQQTHRDDPLGLMMGNAVPLTPPEGQTAKQTDNDVNLQGGTSSTAIPAQPDALNNSPLFDAQPDALNNSPLFAAQPDALSNSPLFNEPQEAGQRTPPADELPQASPLFEERAAQPDYGGITLPTPQAVARNTTPPPKGRLRIDPVSEPVSHQASAASSGDMLEGELLDALIGGMGLNDLQPTPRFDRDSMQELGQMLSMFSQGTVALLSSRSILKRGVKAEMTVILDEANNPFKLLPSGKSVLMQMFGSRMPGFMPPKQSVRDALVDLQAHQLGMIAGIRAIIASMLQSFNPQQLEEEARQEGITSRLSLPGSRKAALWDHFTKRYGETAGEIEDDFHTLFGEAFLHAYDMEVNQYKDSQIRSEE